MTDTIRGERVKALRKHLRLSQKELARKAGTSQTTISDMEKNKHRQPRGVRGVARALSTSEDYLWGRTEDPATTANASLTSEQVDVPTQVTSLSHREQPAVDWQQRPRGAIRGDVRESEEVSILSGGKLLIYGTSLAGGGVMVVTSKPIERRERPDYAASVDDAYGVILTAEDMIPAYEPDDELAVFPSHPIIKGKDYLFLSGDGLDGSPRVCRLRRLVDITDTHWVTTARYPKEREERLSRQEFPLAHRIGGKKNR